eukprot:SAG31_NODE_45127_length_260_cov_0.639752_1_plen_58_part_01
MKEATGDFFTNCLPMVVSGQKIYTKHREQHGGEYILEMLSHLPASICYNDWFRVGCFM